MIAAADMRARNASGRASMRWVLPTSVVAALAKPISANIATRTWRSLVQPAIAQATPISAALLTRVAKRPCARAHQAAGPSEPTSRPSDSAASHQPSHAADSPRDCTFSGTSIVTQGIITSAATKLQSTQPRSIGMAQLTRRPTRNSVAQARRGGGATVASGRGSRVASSAAANSSSAPSHSVQPVPTAASTVPANAGPTSRPAACADCCSPSACDSPAGGTSSVTMLLVAGCTSALASTAIAAMATTTSSR